MEARHIVAQYENSCNELKFLEKRSDTIIEEINSAARTIERMKSRISMLKAKQSEVDDEIAKHDKIISRYKKQYHESREVVKKQNREIEKFQKLKKKYTIMKDWIETP